ncbi:hypothetical protein [Streptomyces lonarensis]|uniref:Lipoprotein n=1 Tax=Streptomyces lonarensis TaxID=700599 RepID=A0A7X6CXE0_9ACTN|nr:hypothetical protein [Streptomyces lonarensis]NJQ04278.1 hypothetical protein [Streptomyces lonarensis]
MTRTRAAIAATTLLAALALTACGGDTEPEPAEAGDSLTAQQLADELGEVTTLTDPRDNTGFCNTADHGDRACEQMITSEELSVYQLPSEDVATQYADTQGERSTQIGAFVLAWNDDGVDDETRAAVEERARELISE